MATKKKQTFEDKLTALETFVRSLEEGGIPLEESLKLYETAMNLSRELESELGEARQRLTVLRQSPDGTAVEEPLSLEAE